MKLNIKKIIPEYEIKKEESMVDIAVQELEENEVFVPIKVVINASGDIGKKKS